jgi:hypothetical protein
VPEPRLGIADPLLAGHTRVLGRCTLADSHRESGRFVNMAFRRFRLSQSSANGQLDLLSRAVIALLCLLTVICVASMVAFYNRSSVIEDLSPTTASEFASGPIRNADDQVAVTGVFFWLSVLVMIPMFITWQYRHAVRAEKLATRIRFSSAWAIAGWFIPVGNLVLPGLQLYGASKASDPSLSLDADAEQGRGSDIVKGWAIALGVCVGFWVSSTNTTAQAERSFEYDVVGAAARADRYSSYAFLALAAAGVLGALMVRELAVRQAAKLHTLEVTVGH